jgi:hypothetical protein
MIGGHDISFHIESSTQIMEGAIQIILTFWPDAIAENAETGKLQIGQEIKLRIFDKTMPLEVLVYKNANSRESWINNGAIPENANLMIEIICGADSITVVVDDPNAAEMFDLLNKIRNHISKFHYKKN